MASSNIHTFTQNVHNRHKHAHPRTYTNPHQIDQKVSKRTDKHPYISAINTHQYVHMHIST